MFFNGPDREVAQVALGAGSPVVSWARRAVAHGPPAGPGRPGVGRGGGNDNLDERCKGLKSERERAVLRHLRSPLQRWELGNGG